MTAEPRSLGDDRTAAPMAVHISTAAFQTEEFKSLPAEEQLAQLESARVRVRGLLVDSLPVKPRPLTTATRKEMRRRTRRVEAWLTETIPAIEATAAMRPFHRRVDVKGVEDAVGELVLAGGEEHGAVSSRGEEGFEDVDLSSEEPDESFDVVDGADALLGEDYCRVESDEACEDDDCGGGYDAVPEVYENCHQPRGSNKVSEDKGGEKTGGIGRQVTEIVRSWLDRLL